MEVKIGRVVAGMREKMRWSRETLAAAAGVGPGVAGSVHAVRRIELDEVEVSFADAARIAHAFGHPVDVFVPTFMGIRVALNDAIPEPISQKDARFKIPDTQHTFGGKLLYLRQRKRITQPKLAAKSGVPVSTLAKYEGGHTGRVRLAVAVAIADALGVGLEEFEGCVGVRRRPLPRVGAKVPRPRGRRAKSS